ncbi:zinc finger CCCH domain-containing protein 45-like [Cynara cardunculus var. scolymus]|uniref:zinc finger CCCH domain-containing protein 45-like n=1 Tax=Cynara cardunculus var. scolymus TaxID=59895 RepID=UPI000D62B819|nr:zinc finger CCCH domain-containing protein 45-like [Cynara cardunculus var. scolymus]
MKQFMVDPNWEMEAGSESQETHIQRQRESRIAEVIYLHHSDVPANPSVASDALGLYVDDSRVPIVPLDAINDDMLPDDGGNLLMTLIPTAKVEETTKQPLTFPPLSPQVNGQTLLHRDEVTRTAVALVALIKSKEPGSQIDLELLIQLLRNPDMLEQLMMEHGLSSNQSSIVISALPKKRSSVPMSIPRPSRRELHPVVTGSTSLSIPGPPKPKAAETTWSLSVPFAHSMSREVKSMIDQIDRNSGSQSNESIPVKQKAYVPIPSSISSEYNTGEVRELINEYRVPLRVDYVKPGSSSSPSAATTVMKDSHYYRRLISKHGVTRENSNPQGSLKRIGVSLVEQRPPCVYFNSPRGCKHGPSCWFQHIKVNMDGGSRGVEEQQRAKRMKALGGNFGRHT